MTVPRQYLCYRAAQPPQIDGKLDKAFWQDAPWTEDFVDIEGEAQPHPPFRTRVKMLWDDEFLYIGAEMEEPHVWATLTEHDAVIFQDNDFEVFLDPDGDNHDYYEIEINALNTTWDLRLVKPYRDGGPALNSWEIPGFRSAVHVQGTLNDPSDIDKGWLVEMAFPWTVLAEYANCPIPPTEGAQWRINFSRVEWDVVLQDGDYQKIPGRPEHNWVWSPQGVIDMHRPEHWGYLQFTALPPGTAIFVPDPAASTRDLLMQVYEAQKAFYAAHGYWASDLAALSFPNPTGIDQILPVEIQVTSEGFVVTCHCYLPSGDTQTWHVREDSRLWRSGVAYSSETGYNGSSAMI